MTAETPVPDARRRLRSLVRQGRRPSPPLFVPVIVAAAARIENLDVEQLLASPTLLSRQLQALHGLSGADGIVTLSTHGAVAEALGARLDWAAYPPAIAAAAAAPHAIDDAVLDRVLRHPRIEAGLEATRRLKQTLRSEPVLAAMLSGPATLAAELAGSGALSAAALEGAGRITAAMTRACGDAGITLMLVAESAVPAGKVDERAWRSALGTIANVARFFDALPVVVFGGPDAELPAAFARAPVPGVLAGAAGPAADRFPDVACLGPDPAAWTSPRPASLVTTGGEIAADADLAGFRAACARVRRALQGSGAP